MSPNNFYLIFVALLFHLCVQFVTPVHHPDVSHTTFCYDKPSCGPSTWGGVCKTGRKQSPIDIQIPKRIKFAKTKFWMNNHYLIENVHRFYAQNNGHTAQFELNPNTSALRSNLEIYGGMLPGNYKFAQLHFHWGKKDSEGSEHTLNGKRYPMEAHLVHYKSKYSSLTDALRNDDPNGVAVMAVLFKIGKHNKHLSPFIRTISTLHKPGKVTEFDFPLRILDLYPKNLQFAHYSGSLTTPTCDEKVIWTVFLDPMQISEGQMTEFRLLRNEENARDANFRPIQPRHGRRVEFYAAKG